MIGFTPPQDATLRVLNAKVFPSTTKTVMALVTDNRFDGAHDYLIHPMVGYNAAAGECEYMTGNIYLPFAKKEADGTMRPGLQTEQLLHLLLDRHEKLNAEFPSDQHQQFMAGIQQAIDALEFRFRERMDRGVAGEHKK